MRKPKESKEFFFFVEEKCMETFLKKSTLLKGVPNDFTKFRGKSVLLKEVAKRIGTLEKEANHKNYYYIILVDKDNDDCNKLKQGIVDGCEEQSGGLLAKGRLLVRIVCRELESWYLGDLNAVKSAYPKSKISKNKNPEKITKPYETILKSVDETSKNRMAEKIAPHLYKSYKEDRTNNTSPSFHYFIEAWDRMKKGQYSPNQTS